MQIIKIIPGMWDYNPNPLTSNKWLKGPTKQSLWLFEPTMTTKRTIGTTEHCHFQSLTQSMNSLHVTIAMSNCLDSKMMNTVTMWTKRNHCCSAWMETAIAYHLQYCVELLSQTKNSLLLQEDCWNLYCSR